MQTSDWSALLFFVCTLLGVSNEIGEASNQSREVSNERDGVSNKIGEGSNESHEVSNKPKSVQPNYRSVQQNW